MIDLLIGAADLYDWPQVRNWAKSIREVGYSGDVALICYRVSEQVVKECEALNIVCFEATTDNFGQPIQHNSRSRNTQSHQLRFFHAAWAIEQMGTLQHVVMTDVRDVVFQKDPFVWLKHLMIRNDLALPIIAPSEALLYRDEPWGADNMQRGFGPVIWEKAQHWPIANVGTIAGPAYRMKDLFLTLYSMTEGRYIPSDQSAFNVLINTLLKRETQFTQMSSGWAAQCGTTLDPQKIGMFETHLLERVPVIKEGIVYTANSEKFCIVHQYDRVPGLNEAVNKRYA